MSSVGFTCDSGATNQVCERDKESWGAPEVGVQQGCHSLTQLVQQPGISFIQQAIPSQLQK